MQIKIFKTSVVLQLLISMLLPPNISEKPSHLFTHHYGFPFTFIKVYSENEKANISIVEIMNSRTLPYVDLILYFINVCVLYLVIVYLPRFILNFYKLLKGIVK